MTNVTEDAFLGGRLRIKQPREGYRAGADPVFLAAAVPGMAGDRVLELGCGVGVALACLKARVPNVVATGIERHGDLAELARRNVAGEILVADLAALPGAVSERSWDHVMLNPPFFDRARGPATTGTREAGRGEVTPLPVWLDVALRRLRPLGTLTLIQRIERLPAVLSTIGDRAGDLCVLPLAPRARRPARLFLLQARKGARGAFRLVDPFVLHEGDHHARDGADYTADADAILRGGAALSMETGQVTR